MQKTKDDSLFIDDLISGKSPDDYMEFNFDDCLVNCGDSCLDCDFISGDVINDPIDYISEDVIEKKIEIATAKAKAVQKEEKVLACSKCGMYDSWNSKGKDGKYYCYKHCEV